MFGWEFPPYKSGGLGTACHDLTKGLSRNGVDCTFVMPVAPDKAKADFVKLLGVNNVLRNIKIRGVRSTLTAYASPESYDQLWKSFGAKFGGGSKEVYGQDLFEEVYRFTVAAASVAQDEEHDIIHAHDWMTYQAAVIARDTSKKPLVVHIHATEYDRTGGNPNEFIAGIEKYGMEQADLIIANSNFTKNNVIKAYGLNPDKIRVVHWGIEEDKPAYHLNFTSPINKEQKEKVVLFLGRITIQKGPDYFLEAARRVLKHHPKTRFVVVGSGDMLPRMMFRSATMGFSNKVLFTGALGGDEVHKAFQMADLYVMPSVSEPFGLVALEALKNGTPIIISKQSGASEVINNCLKVDFWDVDELTNKIVSCLKYDELLEELRVQSTEEVKKFNLDEPARKTIDIYKEVLNNG